VASLDIFRVNALGLDVRKKATNIGKMKGGLIVVDVMLTGSSFI
jgi:hypothetical protein